MFNSLSIIFKYIFIIIIYMFIFSIIRLIYLDIRSLNITGREDGAYLKLINLQETLSYRLKEYYPIINELTMGRGSMNNVVIKDPYVSSRHLKINLAEDGRYYLKDLESSNGTYVNDKRVEDKKILKNGDRIRVGKIEFLFVNRE